MNITKTIIPAAGLGVSFLPLSKAIPKEMLPLLNKPAIQYIVEESLAADIKNVIIVSNRYRNSLVDYFDSDFELKEILQEQGRQDLLHSLEKIVRHMSFTYVRQAEPLSLGHALHMTGHMIDPKEYVNIMIPEDIILNSTTALQQIMQIALQEKASVIAVQEVPIEAVPSFGMIAVKKQISPRLFQVAHVVEKPRQQNTPSNLAVCGRFILSGKIFKSLAAVSSYTADDLFFTEALNAMIKNNEKVYAYKIQGARYDISNPVSWVKALIAMSLENPLYAAQIRQFLTSSDTAEALRLHQVKGAVQAL